MPDPELERAARSGKWDSYVADIRDGLDEAYTGRHTISLEWDLWNTRAIVFSDLHKGARNAADDFHRCEQAYLRALDHYYAEGYTLVLLGDVEELWEEKAADVVRSYAAALTSERRFVAARRYLRMWGNHDDDWMDTGNVESHLAPALGPEVRVCEAAKVTFVDGAHRVGTLFLVHGHQGTGVSDKYRGVSRWVVRNLWRPFQRLTNVTLNTPSKDEVLREKHDIAMYSWAFDWPDQPILIAGHTHRPVFLSSTILASLRLDLARLRLAAGTPAAPPDVHPRIAAIEYRIAQAEQDPREFRRLSEVVPMSKPCYFNAGGCCFRDGVITGIEITAGEFRYVRWNSSGRQTDPQPGIGIALAYAKLADPDQW